MSDDIKFGGILKSLRTKNNLSKAELSRRLGVSDVTIHKWENGQTQPQMSRVDQIAYMFGVTTDQLLGLKDLTGSKEEADKYRLPIISAISAGGLESAIELTDEYIELIPPNKEQLFSVRVNGESMNKVLPNGTNAVAIKATHCPVKNGDVVVFSIDNELSIKRFYDLGEYINFSPDSSISDFEPIVIPKSTDKQVRILGKVLYFQGSL